MNERQFEDIIERYPELLENGLIVKGRQVSVKGKCIDLLFEDGYGQKLIVELKVGPIKRDHIGQIMDYEGHLLTPDDPTVRIMLIGNRVPNNFRRALDHHGIEWRELPESKLIKFLKEKKDIEFLSYFSEPEIHDVRNRKKKMKKAQTVSSGEKWVENGIAIDNKEKAINLFSKIKDKSVLDFLTDIMKLLNEKMEIHKAVTNEFKYWISRDKHCSVYIRPAAEKIDIYLEEFSVTDIQNKSKSNNLTLNVNENTSNRIDQFESVITVDRNWLDTHGNRRDDLLDFITKIIGELSPH